MARTFKQTRTMLLNAINGFSTERHIQNLTVSLVRKAREAHAARVEAHNRAWATRKANRSIENAPQL